METLELFKFFIAFAICIIYIEAGLFVGLKTMGYQKKSDDTFGDTVWLTMVIPVWPIWAIIFYTIIKGNTKKQPENIEETN